uniref:Uncharacterized protein n=1 Tax=Arundo donax TaxID=35708 RepID=A0A0A8Z9J2_ARUDO
MCLTSSLWTLMLLVWLVQPHKEAARDNNREKPTQLLQQTLAACLGCKKPSCLWPFSGAIAYDIKTEAMAAPME